MYTNVRRMNRLLSGLLALSVVLFGACMSDDDDEVEVSNYCYISKLSLGSFKRALTTKASDGSDSTYYTSISGNYFPMTIDHKNLIIENRDSLPYGADVSAVLFTASYDGVALSYRAADADSAAEWSAYSTKDSVDFTKPIHLSVTARDLKSYRIYTVKVNIHQQEGDSLYWTRTDSVPDMLEHMTETHALWMDGKLNVMGKTADAIQLATRGTDGWTLTDCATPAGFDMSTLRQARGKLYASTAEGQIYASGDAISWETVGQPQEGLQLVAVTENQFYALVDGKLLRSEDAVLWENEELDENASLLPTHNVLSMSYTEKKNGRQRLLLAGAGSQPTGRSVWAKNWRAAQEETSAMWMYYTHNSADNPYPCPVLRHQTLLSYDSRLFTFGGERTDGEGKAMDCLYVSNDNGVTWKRDLYLHLPYILVGVEGPVTAVTDDDNHIWIIADNQVWRGRLNRLAFDRQ